MDFGTAISKAVHNGQPVTRVSWVGAFVVRDGDALNKLVGNSASAYEPTQADMLADDWSFAGPADTNTLSLPFQGDAWPGAPDPSATNQAGIPHATVVDATIELKAPPGGFISTINDPHAEANRDPDAAA